jgi:hypothetical protein
MGFARQGGLQATHQREEKREGGSGTGTRVKIESRQVCWGKRSVQCKGEASATPCRSHSSTTHVSPDTDGFHRTHSDSDLTSVERSPDTGATSHRCSNYSRSLVAMLSLSLFSLFSY